MYRARTSVRASDAEVWAELKLELLQVGVKAVRTHAIRPGRSLGLSNSRYGIERNEVQEMGRQSSGRRHGRRRDRAGNSCEGG